LKWEKYLQERPLWLRICDDLERKIRSRELSPGDKVDTEQELARKYMVNRHTVRRALGALQSKGLVETTQGRGSFVRRQTLVIRIRRRTRFSDNMKHVGINYRHELRVMDTLPAEPHVAKALGIKPGAGTVVIERVAFANDGPIGVGRHHFSHARLPLFIDMYKTRQSITDTLRDSGILDYVRAHTTVLARLPTPSECELLELPRHVPLIITRSVNNDMLGGPLEYGETRFAADRVELRIDGEDFENRNAAG
jgi:GntR family transcriptional regulator, phosphonate transport system regulatory protein